MNVPTRTRLSVFWIFGIGLSLTAEDMPVSDETIKPIYFETLVYPVAARFTHVQGAVVVRVKLDTQGKVVSSVAISGAKTLISDCLSNSKKWRFEPNADKTAVIIYRFEFQGLCNMPCPSQFRFQPPNLATVTIGEPVIDHSAN